MALGYGHVCKCILAAASGTIMVQKISTLWNHLKVVHNTVGDGDEKRTEKGRARVGASGKAIEYDACTQNAINKSNNIALM